MKLLKIVGGVVVGVAAVAAAPFTGGGSILAGAAALGLGTTAAVAGAVLVGAAGGFVGSLWDEGEVSFSIAVLGMEGSGKTTFLNKVRNISGIPTPTVSEKKHENFLFKLPNGREVKIEKSIDTPGHNSYLHYYDSAIENKKVIFYFFNINDYLIDLQYRRECNSRLDFINGKIMDKKIVVVATHADKNPAMEEELKFRVLKLIEDKTYSRLFKNNFFILNMINESDFRKLTEIFEV